MNASSVVRDAILAQLEVLDATMSQLNDQSKKIDQEKIGVKQERDSLSAALKRLKTARASKKSSGVNQRQEKQGLKQVHVMPLCSQLVKTKPGITKERLKEGVKNALGERDEFDLRGVDQRIKECLSANEFSIRSDGTVWPSSLPQAEVNVMNHSQINT